MPDTPKTRNILYYEKRLLRFVNLCCKDLPFYLPNKLEVHVRSNPFPKMPKRDHCNRMRPVHTLSVGANQRR